MVANLFFRLNISRFKATACRVTQYTSTDVKNGSSNVTDFAMTRLLLPRLWQISHHTTANCQNRGQMDHSNETATLSSRKKNKMASASGLRNGCPSLGRSQPSQCDMPWDKSELKAESYQNPQNLENRSLHQWMRYCTNRSLETANF
jgi:hypothetical protein